MKKFVPKINVDIESIEISKQIPRIKESTTPNDNGKKKRDKGEKHRTKTSNFKSRHKSTKLYHQPPKKIHSPHMH